MGTVSARLWRYARRTLAVGLGLGLGLGVTEIALRHRDHGAFPNLHTYRPDALLGVTLTPGDHQRYGRAELGTTNVRINRDGYRGEELPRRSHDEVLMVGDSQVFGLGVDDDETAAAGLADRLSTSVVNAGVPSYGPLEYVEVARTLAAARRPTVIVVVLDLATDSLELDVPARDRVTAMGGWLVGKGSTENVTQLPFDDALRDSHVRFALRQLEAPAHHAISSPSSLPVLAAKTRAAYDRAARFEQSVKDASDAAIDAFRRAERAIVAEPLLAPLVAKERGRQQLDRWKREQAFRGCYCDCFYPVQDRLQDFRHDLPGYESELSALGYGYDSDPPPGTLLSLELEADVRDRVAHLESPSEVRLRDVLDLLEQRDELAEAARSQRQQTTVAAHSIFLPVLSELARISTASGARLLVTVVPLRSQLGWRDERKVVQYTPDLSDDDMAEVALADVRIAALDVGADYVDAQDALRWAGGGVLLDDDPHLSAEGHDALAAALYATLRQPHRPPDLR